MRRREFIALGGSAAVTWSRTVDAQQPGKVWRIGHVFPAAPGVTEPQARAFEQRLVELGYTPGRNLMLAHRLIEPKDIEETFVALIPDIDLLVVWTTLGSAAAKRLVKEKPVVFLAVGAPVNIGLVESLAYPGGNMTGVTFEAASETYGRRLQILVEGVPELKRVAVLRTIGDPNSTFAMESLERAAPQLGVTLQLIDIKTADDLPNAFEAMTASKAQALLIISSAVTFGASKRIAALSLTHKLPSCSPFREAVVAGGYVSLGPDLLFIAKQGAEYVNKIIRGAKPSDLAVEQPSRYQLHLNLKTAKTLGLTVPPSLLARADEVIE